MPVPVQVASLDLDACVVHALAPLGDVGFELGRQFGWRIGHWLHAGQRQALAHHRHCHDAYQPGMQAHALAREAKSLCCVTKMAFPYDG
jgi:hypothetical protein